MEIHWTSTLCFHLSRLWARNIKSYMSTTSHIVELLAKNWSHTLRFSKWFKTVYLYRISTLNQLLHTHLYEMSHSERSRSTGRVINYNYHYESDISGIIHAIACLYSYHGNYTVTSSIFSLNQISLLVLQPVTFRGHLLYPQNALMS